MTAARPLSVVAPGPPSVPELPAGVHPLDAALVYAAHGWFPLPVDPGTKKPGSVVGMGWPDQSTREPAALRAWWRVRPDAAVALHVGKSGAVAFDVDDPTVIPDVLRAAIEQAAPPFQSTRSDDPQRGHYVFAAEPGRFGNSAAGLGAGWGEVRGWNGIIVVEPTPHVKAAQGGRYRWVRSGPLPALTDALAACLRPPGAAGGPGDVDQLADFVDSLPGPDDADPCPAAARVLDVLPAASRHDGMVQRTLQLARLGEQGHHGVRAALDQLREWFTDAVAAERDGGRDEADGEFDRALSGAVRNALASPTPAGDRGCCGGIGELDRFAWADLSRFEQSTGHLHAPAQPGVQVAAHAVESALPAVAPRPRSRLHGQVLEPGAFRGEPAPAAPYVLDGLVRAGDLVALVSAAKAGKSLLVLDRVLAAVAAGWRVVYFDAENGFRDVHARVHALGHGTADLSLLTYVSFPSLTLDEQAGAFELCNFVGELSADGPRPVDLVVLDTASRFLSGDENDAAPWLAMYRLALQPLKRAGVAVLRLDHLGKDVTRGARGSSAKSSDVDAVFELAAEAPQGPGSPVRVQLEATMQRSGDYEHFVTLVRGVVDHVLGHRRVGDQVGATIVADPGDVAGAIARALDAAGAPPGTGRERAQKLVGEQFPTAPAKAWELAVKRRKAAHGPPAQWQLPTAPGGGPGA